MKILQKYYVDLLLSVLNIWKVMLYGRYYLVGKTHSQIKNCLDINYRCSKYFLTKCIKFILFNISFWEHLPVKYFVGSELDVIYHLLFRLDLYLLSSLLLYDVSSSLDRYLLTKYLGCIKRHSLHWEFYLRYVTQKFVKIL